MLLREDKLVEEAKRRVSRKVVDYEDREWFRYDPAEHHGLNLWEGGVVYWLSGSPPKAMIIAYNDVVLWWAYSPDRVNKIRNYDLI